VLVPDRALPICPAGKQDCPILAEYLRLQEECRRLLSLSQTDPLTGLYNRGYLMEALTREMERSRRTGLATGLVMMDLNNFKQINDTYGHQVGDAVLVRVAQFLRDNLRQLDMPCRYGGDEFAIILPGTRLPSAVRLAERLAESLSALSLEAGGQRVTFTACFGVDTYDGREPVSPQELLKRADDFLLQAKARKHPPVCSGPAAAALLGLEVGAEERSALLQPRKSQPPSRESRP